MAFGNATFSDAGSAVSDLFSGFGDLQKAQGDYAEAHAYDLAAKYAIQNEDFTRQSTAIKEVQEQRQIYQGVGTAKADITGSGMTLSGSGLDILRSSAEQGALTKQVLAQQGAIDEAGYQEQHDAYQSMAAAARYAGNAAGDAAFGSFAAGGINAAGSIATLLPSPSDTPGADLFREAFGETSQPTDL